MTTGPLTATPLIATTCTDVLPLGTPRLALELSDTWLAGVAVGLPAAFSRSPWPLAVLVTTSVSVTLLGVSVTGSIWVLVYLSSTWAVKVSVPVVAVPWALDDPVTLASAPPASKLTVVCPVVALSRL